MAPVPLARWVAQRLAPWFATHQRDLAWRGTRDPYAIWVSEVMLQQTRVETVAQRWPAFVQRFPDVHTLAAATEAQVLEAWSGLGYYRRARALHAGARYVAAEHGGHLPQDVPALRRIPGVGPYTAGALASIAFDRPEPLVDGNVARVLSRLRGVEDPVAQPASAPAHWAFVGDVVAAGQPRVLAQALMELGATVCTPGEPRCGACPLATRCAARLRGVQREIPAVRRRAHVLLEEFVAALIVRDGAVLLQRRPAQGLLAGLWCPPLLPCPGAGTSLARVAREVAGLRLRFSRSGAGVVDHMFTHRRWRVQAFRARLERALPEDAQWCWWVPRTAAPGGIPTLTRRLLALVPGLAEPRSRDRQPTV
jgi:A/G-specific adenine glycosylase